MDIFFILLLFGHLFGDYFFQSYEMALKKKSDFNLLLLHSIVYSVVVTIFTFIPIYITFRSITACIVWIIVILLSHIILDGTNFIDNWLNIINSRSYQNTNYYIDYVLKSNTEKQYAIAFTAIVQVVTDNTLHLTIMYLGYIIMKFIII